MVREEIELQQLKPQQYKTSPNHEQLTLKPLYCLQT